MASTPFEPMYPGTAGFFDIYTDFNNPQQQQQPPPPQQTPEALPSGGCNYVDLNPGANGAKCGCRRFWARQVPGSGGGVQDGNGWCMCNHHACYHDHGNGEVAGTPTSTRAGSVGLGGEGPRMGQENERPRMTGRAPLSPVVVGDAMLPPMEHQSFGNMNHQLSYLQGHNAGFGPPSPSLAFQTQRQDMMLPPSSGISTPRRGGTIPPPMSNRGPGSLPDTAQWAGYSQGGLDVLPAIPSQCLMPSQSRPPSVASSTAPGYLRPFAGKGLNTLTGPRGSRPHSPIDFGDTNPATQMPPPPRIASTRTSPDNIPDTLAFLPDTASPGIIARPKSEPVNDMAATEERFKSMSETMNGHGERLDRLESQSFTANHDDCAERSDQVDLRVTDLESRMEEVEKLVNDNASVISKSDATQSNASFATSITSRPAYSQELHSQVLALQAEVKQLRSSIPTFAHPWEVEVVFLPFPLQKLWLPIQDFQHDAMINKDDWTQMPMTYSAGTMASQSPFYNDWAEDGQQNVQEWLLPKACGGASIVDKRLRSRGLIQTISVKGPDARSVNSAMHSVFGQVLKEMDLVSPGSEDARAAKFLGLQSSWVPLRKVHKDSRLRFLTPAEMSNPTFWDVQFLSSVMMRGSQQRLFVTHPDAYLQDEFAYQTGWSWHRIRTMTRVYPEVVVNDDDDNATQGSSFEVPEADAMEECWVHNEQYDQPNSVTSGLGKPQRRRGTISSSPSQVYHSARRSWGSSSAALQRGQSPMLRSRRGSARPLQISTTSSAPGIPSRTSYHSPLSAGRRVLSGARSTSRRGTPASQQAGISKRARRRTRSPSHARFTPRWTASPSPVPMGFDERQQRTRATTPVAYATPHSNAPLQELRQISAGSVVMRDVDNLLANHGDDDDDDDFDINIYESEDDHDLYDENVIDVGDNSSQSTENNSLPSEEVTVHAHAQPRRSQSMLYAQQQQQQTGSMMPEDEVWPGIEDRDGVAGVFGMDEDEDEENVDPMMEDDRDDRESVVSRGSSRPSEYPSGAREEEDGQMGGFRIHED